VLENFASVFRRVWIASAFKGATGSDQIYTDANFHVSNHESWLRLISSVEQAGKPLTIAGWALTGWSRYTHLMALCEIMPIAMPSLAMCMWTLGATRDNLGKLLNCSGVVNVGDDSALGQCRFVGSQIYGDIVLLRNVHNAYRSRILGSMRSVSEVLAAKPSKEILEFADVQLKTIKLIENRLAVAMRELFFDDTVEEWFQTHVARIKADLTRMVST
jgi:hexosaminidase